MAFPFAGFHSFSEAFLGPVDRASALALDR